jgi:hypothetical protein
MHSLSKVVAHIYKNSESVSIGYVWLTQRIHIKTDPLDMELISRHMRKENASIEFVSCMFLFIDVLTLNRLS